MSAYHQSPLFNDPELNPVPFPSTRYQGSKRKLADWIWENVRHLPFDSVLDVFGGTGVVSHRFKLAGKAVTYNDKLMFNWNIGLGLIQNSSVNLKVDDVDTVLRVQKDVIYPTFIQDTFKDIYFYDDENAWLDRAIYNIDHFIHDPYKQSLARFALFQSCIAKRPYNLFHRANLYMRSANVERSFGNKSTWDTPFEKHFRVFVGEANAAVFDNHRHNEAINVDAFETPTGADLVYLDPPYLNSEGKGLDYRDFYHFLEGMMSYSSWAAKVDYKSKHKRLIPEQSIWLHPKTITQAFESIIDRHRSSVVVISYRDDGIPSKNDLVKMLRQYKQTVECVTQSQKYVLSHRTSHELLLIAY